MNRRELKDATFLGIADDLSMLGTCDRKRVGAVIVRDGRCITWGFNGAPPGADHCSMNAHGWALSVEKWPCARLGRGNSEDCILMEEVDQTYCAHCGWSVPECRNATHAEANALAFAARQGISTEGGTCYVTVSPCEICARLLIAAGIVRVVYTEEYRDRRGIEVLHASGISATCGDGSLHGGSAGS